MNASSPLSNYQVATYFQVIQGSQSSGASLNQAAQAHLFHKYLCKLGKLESKQENSLPALNFEKNNAKLNLWLLILNYDSLMQHYLSHIDEKEDAEEN